MYKPWKYSCFNSTGQSLMFDSKAYDAHVHLREGSIVPLQNTTELTFSTTADLQNKPVDFHILGKMTSADSPTNFRASGSYYNDDGEIFNETDNLNSYQIVAS